MQDNYQLGVGSVIHIFCFLLLAPYLREFWKGEWKGKRRRKRGIGTVGVDVQFHFRTPQKVIFVGQAQEVPFLHTINDAITKKKRESGSAAEGGWQRISFVPVA